MERDLGRIAEDQSFYLLGYPAPNPGDGHIRRLRVELKSRGGCAPEVTNRSL